MLSNLVFDDPAISSPTPRDEFEDHDRLAFPFQEHHVAEDLPTRHRLRPSYASPAVSTCRKDPDVLPGRALAAFAK